MKTLGKFQQYIPDPVTSSDLIKVLSASEAKVLFFKNQDNKDWLDFRNENGRAVAVDDQKKVVSVSSDITMLSPDNLTIFVLADGETIPAIGWHFDGQNFVEPPEQEPPLLPVTRKQLIDVLIEHDLDERVEPALRDEITDPKALKKALNAWQNASQYEPDHPLVSQLKGVLKLKDEQFDAFWREAMAS